MKILFVNGHLSIGGVEKSLVDVLNTIDYTKHSIDLLLFEGYGEYYSQVPKEVNVIMCDITATYGSLFSVIKSAFCKKNIKTVIMKIIFVVSSRFGTKYISLLRLLKIVNKKYDCAIAYRTGFAAEYVGYVVNAKKKYVWWHSGQYDVGKKVAVRCHESLRKMDTIVCVSNAAKELVAMNFEDMLDKVAIIPNMIFGEKIKNLAQEFEPYYGNECVKLVSVGRMTEEKHMIDSVAAMERLIMKGYTSVHWYLVGDGAEREKIENEIIKKDLQKNITCLGNQANPYPYIRNADIFVHLSHVESQGIAVLEAFVLGIPSVVTKSAGVGEFVINGGNAIVAEPQIEDLVDKIILMIEEPNYSNKFKDKQKETCEKFTPEEVIKNIMSLIE